MAVAEFSAALRVRFPFWVPQDGARGRRAYCATSASGDPALAHAARRTREVTAAAAAAAAAPINDARDDARTQPTSHHKAQTTSSCASFVSISSSHARGGARSLACLLSRTRGHGVRWRWRWRWRRLMTRATTRAVKRARNRHNCACAASQRASFIFRSLLPLARSWRHSLA